MKNSALVVIDLQNDITKHYREIIENVNAAIDWAVQKELWVVYIQHNNLSAGTRTFKPGTRGAELVPEMKVVFDHVFTKVKSSALTSEPFAAFIREHGITEFYLAGADAAACVKSTSYNMRKSGYAVHVLSDCITSYDKKKLPELLKEGHIDPNWLTQVRAMCGLLYPAGLNIDYYPTNFVPRDGTLYYIDYECSAYMEQWDFEHWGVQYWAVPTSEG